MNDITTVSYGSVSTSLTALTKDAALKTEKQSNTFMFYLNASQTANDQTSPEIDKTETRYIKGADGRLITLKFQYTPMMKTTEIDKLIAAPLEDHSDTPITELYDTNSYKIIDNNGVVKDPDTGVVTIKLAAENLRKHTNGATPGVSGYWVGIALPVPSDVTDLTKAMYTFGETASSTATSASAEKERWTSNSQDYISFYANLESDTPKLYVSVDWDGAGSVYGVEQFVMDVSAVGLQPMSKATFAISTDSTGGLLGKNASDLIANGSIIADETTPNKHNVRGDLTYIESWSEWGNSGTIHHFVPLTITCLLYTSSNKTVTWTSDKTAVATVDAQGVVKGVSEGTATITATSNNGKTATCTVTVSAATPTVKNTYNPTTKTLTVAVNNSTITGGTTALDGNVVPTTISALNVSSDLADGNATLSGITVEGATTIAGGGANSVHFNNCTLKGAVTVNKAAVRVAFEGTTAVNNKVVLQKPAKLESTNTTLPVVEVQTTTTAGEKVVIAAPVTAVEINQASTCLLYTSRCV